MPEPFKTVFNQSLVDHIAVHVKRHCEGFDDARFTQLAMHGLEDLELKARAGNILDALGDTLPDEFEESCTVLAATLHPETEDEQSETNPDLGLRGWAIFPLSMYVAQYGLHDPIRSLDLLKEMTKRFTSEFAIRAFLENDLHATLEIIAQWTRHPDRHVRRLVSEGTRPRLPWAGRLPELQRDPSPILALLDALKDDQSEYVRRSVANSLNDISKDHPEVISKLAAQWVANASDQRLALIRHACRTLVKQGHKETLATFGFKPPSNLQASLIVENTSLNFGSCLCLGATIQSSHREPQSVALDFVVHHRKANGGTTPKVFKWTSFTLEPGETKTLSKRHPIRPITTRRYYPGRHEVELLINGVAYSRTPFELLMNGTN